jgi:hypothetical protein
MRFVVCGLGFVVGPRKFNGPSQTTIYRPQTVEIVRCAQDDAINDHFQSAGWMR